MVGKTEQTKQKRYVILSKINLKFRRKDMKIYTRGEYRGINNLDQDTG